MEFTTLLIGSGSRLSGFALGGEIEMAYFAGDYFGIKKISKKRVRLAKTTKICADICLPLKKCKLILQNNKIIKREEQ